VALCVRRPFGEMPKFGYVLPPLIGLRHFASPFRLAVGLQKKSSRPRDGLRTMCPSMSEVFRAYNRFPTGEQSRVATFPLQ
jgi:hypothetical protein